MKNILWDSVYQVFHEVAKEGPNLLEAERLIDLRKRLRVKLDFLRSQLAVQLNEREIYYVLFPIVIYLDEIIQAKMLPGERVEWIPLQKEIYEIDTGGDLFYTVLDDLLRKPDTYPFIYEVFYFCLSDGFVGRHEGNLVTLNNYKEKLGARIEVTKLDEYREEPPMLEPVKVDRNPLWYYVLALALIVALYFGLKLLARYNDALLNLLNLG